MTTFDKSRVQQCRCVEESAEVAFANETLFLFPRVYC